MYPSARPTRDDRCRDRTLQQHRRAQQQIGTEMNGQCTVEHRTRWRRTFHRPWKPASKGKLGGFSERRKDQQECNHSDLNRRRWHRRGRPRSCALYKPGAALQVMQPDRCSHQRNVTDSIRNKRTKGMTYQRGTLVKKCDQQGRSDTDQFPHENYKFQTRGQNREVESCTEQNQQDVKPRESTLAMKIPTRKRPYHCDQHTSEQGHGERETIEHKLQAHTVVPR
jgi:hypothetical protein